MARQLLIDLQRRRGKPLLKKIGLAPLSRLLVPPRHLRDAAIELRRRRFAMDTRSLDRLGDEIAELSAYLDAATARLLDHSRVRQPSRLEHGLSFLRGLAELARGARHRRGPRTRPRGARLGKVAAVGPGVSAGRALVRQGPRADACGDAGDRGAIAGRGPCRP